MKTIKQLMADTDDVVGLPQRVYPLCLAGKIMARAQVADGELGALIDEREELVQLIEIDEQQRGGDGEDPHARMDDPATPAEAARARLGELQGLIEAKRREMDDLDEQAKDHMSPVLLTARRADQWVEFCEEHPPRENSTRDSVVFTDPVTGERYRDLLPCNVDALIGVLDKHHIITVSDQPLEPGQWEWITSVASFEDLREMAVVACGLQNSKLGDRLPK